MPTRKYRQDWNHIQELQAGDEKETKKGQGGTWYKHQAGAKPEKTLDSNSI